MKRLSFRETMAFDNKFIVLNNRMSHAICAIFLASIRSDRYRQNIYISGLNSCVIFKTIQKDRRFDVFKQNLAQEIIGINIKKVKI